MGRTVLGRRVLGTGLVTTVSAIGLVPVIQASLGVVEANGLDHGFTGRLCRFA